MCKPSPNVTTVVVCTVTGTQGKEITQRFSELNEARKAAGVAPMHVRRLTRNKNSSHAKKLAEKYPDLTLVDVDYASAESLKSAFEGT